MGVMVCCIWVCCGWTWRWCWVDRLCGLLLFWLRSLVVWFLSFVFACGMVGWCACRVDCGFGLGVWLGVGTATTFSRVVCCLEFRVPLFVWSGFGFVGCGLILVCGCGLVVLRVTFAFA